MSKQPKSKALKVTKKTVADLSVKNGKAGKVKGGANTVHGPSCPVCGTGATPG